jgi:hypothetical protein
MTDHAVQDNTNITITTIPRMNKSENVRRSEQQKNNTEYHHQLAEENESTRRYNNNNTNEAIYCFFSRG